MRPALSDARPRGRRVGLLAIGLLVATVLALAGCGGLVGPGDTAGGTSSTGGGTTSLPGAGTAGTPVSAAERLSSLEEVEAEVARLAGSGGRYEPQQMLAYLAQQSAYSKVGYNAQASCAWAVYTDGRLLMVANEPPPEAPATRSVARRTLARGLVGQSRRGSLDADAPLLTAEQFRSVNTWVSLPLMDYVHVTAGWVDEDTIPRLSRIAAGLGFFVVDRGMVYDHSFARPLVADVEGLKQVTGDGVFLLTTYGGYGERGDTTVRALATLTPAVASGELNQGYEEDLDTGRLVYFVRPYSFVKIDTAPMTCLGITPEFARFYNWSFPGNSLVYLNTTGDTLLDWQSVLESRGARVVMGWVGGAHERTMLGAAQDFFELLFATNNVYGNLWNLETEPRLRSYGIAETYDYLNRQGLLSGVEIDGRAGRLEMFQDYGPYGSGEDEPSSYVNLLRPSIEYLLVDEANGILELQGQFGDLSGEVRIGPGTETPVEPELSMVADPRLTGYDRLEILDWQPHRIQAKLPQTPYSTGMVQVWVGDRFSNVAHLTRWNVTFQINRTVGGTLQRSVTMQVSFRAFVSGYRLWPDEPLDVQGRLLPPATNMDQGAVGWSASGSLSRSESGTTTTVRWSGAGNFSSSQGQGEAFAMTGAIRVPERRLECQLSMGKAGGLHVETETSSAQGTSTTESDEDFHVSTPEAEYPELGALHLSFDENWVLLEGSQTFADNEESVFGDESCQTQVTWLSAVPAFPPEKDRGGR